MITVEPVRGRRDLNAFVELPFTLYRDDPHWVPPLRRERRQFLRHHPFFDYGAVQPFLARRGRRVVGRIAAVDNPRHNEAHAARDGFFGLFESVDDLAVAQALFDTCGKWLAARGLDTMLGPVGYSTNEECGLLVEGFDLPPAVLMPYNPSYYVTLVERAGFLGAKDLWAWDMPTSQVPPRLARLAEAVRRHGRITVRPANLSDYTAEAARMRVMYNSAFEDLWGFVPMTDHEFDYLARQVKPILRPELCLFAELDGEPVGFTLALPDANEALRVAGGRSDPLSLWRMSRALRSISGTRAFVLGVAKAHRDRGIDVLLYTELMKASVELGYRRREVSWTLEDNHVVNNTVRLVGGQRTKTYRLYRRAL